MAQFELCNCILLFIHDLQQHELLKTQLAVGSLGQPGDSVHEGWNGWLQTLDDVTPEM